MERYPAGTCPIRTTGVCTAEQGITPPIFLLFTITAECNIAAGAIGDDKV